MRNYDPAVRAFMKRGSKLLRKGARSKDPSVMWAVLYNLQSVLDGYEEAAHKTMNKNLESK